MSSANKKLFVSVGSRFPFDRLIHAVDRFVGEHHQFSAIAQVGDSSEEFLNLQTYAFLLEKEFRRFAEHADIHISHAGMGNILLAAELKKPVVILPRRPEHREIVNEHQIATVTSLADKPFIFIAEYEKDLPACIFAATNYLLSEKHGYNAHDSAALIHSIKNYLRDL